MRSDARIQINLEDVNNERPEFIGFDENGKYPAAVSEEADPSQRPVVGHLFAIDADGTSPNNNVRVFGQLLSCETPEFRDHLIEG